MNKKGIPTDGSPFVFPTDTYTDFLEKLGRYKGKKAAEIGTKEKKEKGQKKGRGYTLKTASVMTGA